MLAALEFCITALKRELASDLDRLPYGHNYVFPRVNALAIADQRFIFLPF
jgi:hypothetical protein